MGEGLMIFEAEVFPLMVAGVLAVSGLELLFGLRLLRGEPEETRYAFLGHIVSMLVGFALLMQLLFACFGTINSVGGAENSVLLGLFCVCWTVSVGCIFHVLKSVIQNR